VNTFLDEVERAEREEKLVDNTAAMTSRHAQLSRVARFMQNEDFQAFLDSRAKTDESRYRDMIRAETFDSFKAGKVFGRIEIIEDLRTSERRVNEELNKISRALQAQEKKT